MVSGLPRNPFENLRSHISTNVEWKDYILILLINTRDCMNVKQTVVVQTEQEYIDSTSNQCASMAVTLSESPFEMIPIDQVRYQNPLADMMDDIADDILKEVGTDRVARITITPWTHNWSLEHIQTSKALSIVIVLAHGTSSRAEEYRRICTLVKRRAPVNLQNGECLKGCYRLFFSPRSKLWYISQGIPPVG